jgi:hypothetical protein
MDGHSNPVGGVLAYRCTEYDHTFFVRIADIEALQTTPPPTGLKHKKNGSAGGTTP